MNSKTVNPLDLPIVPPMDLNASMPGIDRISPYPMQLRTRRAWGSSEPAAMRIPA